MPLQNENEIRRDFPEIIEGAVRRSAGAAGLLILMMERQLHVQGWIEKGKLRLSQTPLGCGQVLRGVAPRGEMNREGEEVSVECRELQAATTARPIRGRSFHVSARANTPDANGIKAGKKPRGPSKQNIQRQTTVRVSDGPEQGGTKKKGRGHQGTWKAKIWKNIKGCFKRNIPDRSMTREERKVQDTEKKQNAGTSGKPGQGKTERTHFPNSPGGRRMQEEQSTPQKGNPLTTGPVQQPRIKRIPAKGQPHRKMQEAKPPGASPNSGKLRGQRGRTRPQPKG